jgi:dTDP-4-dehydrorhamnose 3,5-epimerase
LEQPKLLKLPFFSDLRGSFFKPFSTDAWEAQLGSSFHPKEVFFSTSHLNVLRGFHFQKPPADHGKIVFCLRGRFLDITLDLRKNGSFGAVEAMEICEGSGKAIYIPSGFAHAFLSLENDTCIGYLVDSVYSPELDYGIHWSSIDFAWPISNPIISPRDEAFSSFANFQTPFI